jgi:hypothetical protein
LWPGGRASGCLLLPVLRRLRETGRAAEGRPLARSGFSCSLTGEDDLVC